MEEQLTECVRLHDEVYEMTRADYVGKVGACLATENRVKRIMPN